MPTEHQLQILLDKQEIYELLCRYCRGCDRLDKELILSCFHPGAIDVHVGRTAGVHYGTIEEFLEKEFEGWKRFEGSQHHIMNHLCEVDGDVALAETYQFSFYWALPGDDPSVNLTNSNRYIDRFERREDRVWRIARREFYRNFTRRETRPFVFPTAENGWPRGSQDRNDPAYRTLKASAIAASPPRLPV